MKTCFSPQDVASRRLESLPTRILTENECNEMSEKITDPKRYRDVEICAGAAQPKVEETCYVSNNLEKNNPNNRAVFSTDLLEIIPRRVIMEVLKTF